MLNESKGNMYDFVTHTWNAIKGKCLHDCSYCYMKRWGKQKSVRFDYKELRTDLGNGNFIFVGSSCDMFANDIPDEWIYSVISICNAFDKNKYLFQTKNPRRFLDYIMNPSCTLSAINPILCTTIESNRIYPDVMKNSPIPFERSAAMSQITLRKFVTIEPIMDFDLDAMVDLIKISGAEQVNIGADSGNHNLPEPTFKKIMDLSNRISEFTKVVSKRNLERISKNNN